MSYFCVGVALQLLRTPLIVYFIVDLDATPAEVNVLFTVMAVPWCFKVIYGFMSDCIPIMGERRKVRMDKERCKPGITIKAESIERKLTSSHASQLLCVSRSLTLPLDGLATWYATLFWHSRASLTWGSV